MSKGGLIFTLDRKTIQQIRQNYLTHLHLWWLWTKQISRVIYTPHIKCVCFCRWLLKTIDAWHCKCKKTRWIPKLPLELTKTQSWRVDCPIEKLCLHCEPECPNTSAKFRSNGTHRRHLFTVVIIVYKAAWHVRWIKATSQNQKHWKNARHKKRGKYFK